MSALTGRWAADGFLPEPGEKAHYVPEGRLEAICGHPLPRSTHGAEEGTARCLRCVALLGGLSERRQRTRDGKEEP